MTKASFHVKLAGGRSLIGRLAFLLLLSALAAPNALAIDSHNAVGLARDIRFAESPAWLSLLHYRDSLTGRESAIDAKEFFFSPEGRTDPASELYATIEAFFTPANRWLPGSHPLCRYPARAKVVGEALNILPGDLPRVECVEYDAYMERLDPGGVTLIFASAHMESPGSMFGHTLLRIDSGEKVGMLGSAVNYAASVDPEDNGFEFAFKGLSGLYPGRFSLLPYWEKIAEYGNMEQRDLWEYPLNLTLEESRLMAMHLWELKAVESDYFFLDENCSYNILFLLEAARPSLKLTSEFSGWVIPIDTVDLALKEGVASEPSFRPSPARIVDTLAATLSDDAVNAAKKLGDGEMEAKRLLESTLSREEKARALEIAASFTQSNYLNRRISLDRYRTRLFDLTTARSGLGITDMPPESLKTPATPQATHHSTRASLTLGAEDEEGYVQVSLRSAYHDLTDPVIGFPEGSQIQFPWLTARKYQGDGVVRLQELGFVDIVSINPIDRFYKPLSWRVGFSLTRGMTSDDDLKFLLKGGAGGATWLKRDRVAAWLLATGRVVTSPDTLGSRVGLGMESGLIVNQTQRARLLLEMSAHAYPYLERGPDFSVAVRQSYGFNRDWAALLSVGRTRGDGFDRDELSLTLNYYF